MTERRSPVRKTPADILADLVAGHNEALIEGSEKGEKYLLKLIERNASIPNAVKFFIYDLLAEDAFKCDDLDTCRDAVTQAFDYMSVAKEEAEQAFRAYIPSIRLFERGIILAIDDGEFERALHWCDQALALGLGVVYTAKRASIERMM